MENQYPAFVTKLQTIIMQVRNKEITGEAALAEAKKIIEDQVKKEEAAMLNSLSKKTRKTVRARPTESMEEYEHKIKQYLNYFKEILDDTLKE